MHCGAIRGNIRYNSKCNLYCKFTSTIDENVDNQIYDSSGNIVENSSPFDCVGGNIDTV